MPLLLETASDLALPALQRGIIPEIVTEDQLYGAMPFKMIDNAVYKYNRESTLSNGAWIGVNTDVEEGASTFTPITTELKRLVGDVDVDNFIQGTQSKYNNQRAIQVVQKYKALARQFANALINGNETSDPQQFNGLKALIDSAAFAAQKHDAAHTALSFELLDILIDLVKIRSGQRAFIMHSRTVRSFFNLVRGMGGASPEMLQLPGVTGKTPSYRDIPILTNDWIGVTETATGSSDTSHTRIYLATMNEEEGVTALAPEDGEMGIQVEDIGKLEKRDATRTRCKWYGGLAVHSTLSLGAAWGVTD